MEDLNREITDKKTISELEESAIIKYEKHNKPYRNTYRNEGRQIKCQKCGSPYSLMKHVDSMGKEFWFCKNCIMERAKEIAIEKRNKKEGKND